MGMSIWNFEYQLILIDFTRPKLQQLPTTWHRQRHLYRARRCGMSNMYQFRFLALNWHRNSHRTPFTTPARRMFMPNWLNKSCSMRLLRCFPVVKSLWYKFIGPSASLFEPATMSVRLNKCFVNYHTFQWKTMVEDKNSVLCWNHVEWIYSNDSYLTRCWRLQILRYVEFLIIRSRGEIDPRFYILLRFTHQRTYGVYVYLQFTFDPKFIIHNSISSEPAKHTWTSTHVLHTKINCWQRFFNPFGFDYRALCRFYMYLDRFFSCIRSYDVLRMKCGKCFYFPP